MALETRWWRRTLLLAGLPVGALARSLRGSARRRRGAEPAAVRAELRRANADHLRDVLGELKGGALKAGQFLSTVDSLFPPDPEATWQGALTALQESTPGLPFGQVEPVLAADLGPGWPDLVPDLEPVAAAAASLGQVHRARWSDGRPVAVKVQYPGVRQAVAADLRSLTAGLRAVSLVAPGVVVPPVVGELRTRLADELDYRREAVHQRAFARAYRADPDVVVPEVLLATPRVLVTTWLDAPPLVTAGGRPDAERADLALRYQTFLLAAPARTGLLHADPHPGNFRAMPDGRLGVLDFGAVVPMPGGLPVTFGRLVRAFADETGPDVLAALRASGLVRAGRTLDVDSLREVMAPFSEPARHDVFAYSPEWLRSCFDRNAQARDPDYTVGLGLALPPDQLMTQRVWLGCVGTLCRLRVTIPVRPVLRAHLPGFADPPRRATGPTR